VVVGGKVVAGGLFTQVATADDPATPIPRSNIFAFDATTGAIDPNFGPVMDNEVESLAVAPDGLHVFAGGRFTKIDGVAQKSLAKLRPSDGARITQFKGKTNARVKDMVQSGGKLYIGGTFSTVDGVVGVFALVSIPEGLWIGSDTDRIGRYEYHGKLAFMPVAGGSAVPEPRVGAMPGELYRLGTTGVMDHRAYDGTAFGAPAPVPGVDWTQARGAFMVSGRLYTGWSDNNLYVRDFDGTTAGPAMALNLAGVNTSTIFPVSRVTGMFFEPASMFFEPASGRLYYTLSGDARLLYRYFTPESGVVGAETFTASATGWSSVSGMTLASGKLYFATSNGNLSAVDFAGGVPSGSPTVISGPAVDGQSWQSRGLFVLAT
jgi:hypothetical protein